MDKIEKDESDNASPIARAAERLSDVLLARKRRLILAESCTAGQVAASLGLRPGVSGALCGSFVTYRNSLKRDVLGIAADVLEHPGAVSREVAEAMAVGALARSTEADLAGSVTGHLGPNDPPELDGTVFFGIATRTVDRPKVEVTEFHCTRSGRADRAAEVTETLLTLLADAVEAHAAEATAASQPRGEGDDPDDQGR